MNFSINNSKPILIEPGVKYFLNETLKQCHDFKTTYNNHLFNIGLLCAFLIVLGLIGSDPLNFLCFNLFVEFITI